MEKTDGQLCACYYGNRSRKEQTKTNPLESLKEKQDQSAGHIFRCRVETLLYANSIRENGSTLQVVAERHFFNNGTCSLIRLTFSKTSGKYVMRRNTRNKRRRDDELLAGTDDTTRLRLLSLLLQ